MAMAMSNTDFTALAMALREAGYEPLGWRGSDGAASLWLRPGELDYDRMAVVERVYGPVMDDKAQCRAFAEFLLATGRTFG